MFNGRKMNASILVVEDNQALSQSLKSWLQKDYKITLVSEGKTALKKLSKKEYDLIILDLGLPDIPGQEVCRQLRSDGNKSPLLVLTASEEVSSRVKLLDFGADDYLLKPFYVSELQARIRALLRRGNGKNQASNVITVADLSIDTNRRLVKRSGKKLQIRPKEYDILEYLMQNHGTVVTRAMIIDTVWENPSEGWNNTVDVHIKFLRDQIDRPFDQQLIKTVYGVGYMIDDAA